MAVTLIKIDKNGTKYFVDDTCPRCGGQGGSEAWRYTGWTCYQCGGTGKVFDNKPYKVYTPEYQAKLDAQREMREAKKKAEAIADFMNRKADKLMELGFNANGDLFCVVGETYSIKDELREHGAKWNPRLNRWYFTSEPADYACIKVNYAEVIEDEIGFWFGKPCFNWKENAGDIVTAKMPKKENKSEYIGKVGDRIEAELVLKRVFSFESRFGWQTTTTYICSFEDCNGNVVVWKTESWGWQGDEGKTYKVRGTIKELSTYKETKQTVLTRCKIA